jgi:pyruvate carboxylase subunit B
VAEGDGAVAVAPAAAASAAPAAAPTAPEAPAPRVATPGATEIRSQTPGNVWKVIKSPGDRVDEGETILILEAMKMEIEIAAPQSGTLATIDVALNDSVQDGQLLATLT